jgi:hypothetical protein
VQAPSKGASTTQALAAADAAAAAVVDRLVSDTSTILMSGYINYGRNVVFDLIPTARSNKATALSEIQFSLCPQILLIIVVLYRELSALPPPDHFSRATKQT